MSSEKLRRTFFQNREFRNERNYVQNGERRSWCRFDSLALTALEFGGIELGEYCVAKLYRYLGGELIDLASYFEAYQVPNDEVANFLADVGGGGQTGYYFGAFPPSRVLLLGNKDWVPKRIFVIRNPKQILLAEGNAAFGSEQEEDTAAYYNDVSNRRRIFDYLRLVKRHAKDPQCLVVRVEDIIREPLTVLIDICLFFSGHEPVAIVEDIIASPNFRSAFQNLEREEAGGDLKEKLDAFPSQEVSLMEEFGYLDFVVTPKVFRGSAVLARSN